LSALLQPDLRTVKSQRNLPKPFYPPLTLTVHVQSNRWVNSNGYSVMKKFFLSLAISTAILVPASAVLAADLDVPPPPPPTEELRQATYDWTGAYVGVLVGSSCEDGDFTYSATGGVFLNAGCGIKGGALMGYNLQVENIVWGIEANIETTGTLTSNGQVGADFEHSMPLIGRLNARVGYAMDDTLLFVTAGGAYAKGELIDNVSTTANKLTANHMGWSLGGGIEHALTDQFRLRLDYLFTKFKDAEYETACCTIDGGPGGEHEVRAGLIWAF
jgi:outer membrane immunogenic protein